jgi:hypothetical protein
MIYPAMVSRNLQMGGAVNNKMAGGGLRLIRKAGCHKIEMIYSLYAIKDAQVILLVCGRIKNVSAQSRSDVSTIPE